MDIRITFKDMDHSDNIEQHARQKLAKITDFFKDAEDVKPLNVEFWLKANKLRAHHRAELSLKTPHLSLNAHDENTDMYVAIDCAIDKMVTQIVKEKEKIQDKNQKNEDTEKSQFSSDKYKL